MASVVISGDTSGSLTLAAPAVAGSGTLTLPTTTGTLALTSDVIGVGINQTWQSVTRVAGTTYTNSTGKPIQVFINMGTSGGGSFTITVGGVSLGGSITVLNNSNVPISFIVPNSTTYVVATSGANIGTWTELR
jgi:hypothetical protein